MRKSTSRRVVKSGLVLLKSPLAVSVWRVTRSGGRPRFEVVGRRYETDRHHDRSVCRPHSATWFVPLALQRLSVGERCYNRPRLPHRLYSLREHFERGEQSCVLPPTAKRHEHFTGKGAHEGAPGHARVLSPFV
jgi:hypothetical protein